MVHIKSRPILDVLFNSKKEIMRKLGRDLVANNCVINTLHKDKTIKDTWKIDSFEVVPKESYFDKYNKGMYGRFFEKETSPREDGKDGYGFHYTTNKRVGYDVPIHLKLFTKEQNGISHTFDVYCEFKNSKFYLRLIHQYVIDGDISIGTMEDGRKTYTKLRDDEPIAKIYGLNDARNIVVTCSPKDYNANQHVNQHVSQHVKKQKHQTRSRHQPKSRSKSKSVSSKSASSKSASSKSASSKSKSASSNSIFSKSASSKSASPFKSHNQTKSQKKKLKWKNKTNKQKLASFK
jgi:hypothetical protein